MVLLEKEKKEGEGTCSWSRAKGEPVDAAGRKKEKR